jgi:hypothetical protein
MRALPFTRPVALNRSAAIVPARTTPVAIIRDAVLGKTLLPVPDDLDLNRAALVEPLAVGLHTVNRGMPNASTKAVVFGCGPIGLAAVLWLARRDVAHIVAIDLADERLDYAKRMVRTPSSTRARKTCRSASPNCMVRETLSRACRPSVQMYSTISRQAPG